MGYQIKKKELLAECGLLGDILCVVLVINLKGSDQLEDVGGTGEIILKGSSRNRTVLA